MGTSNKFSFKGWKLGAWLKGNREAVKLIIATVGALIIPTNPVLKILLGSVIKLALDSVDFYVNEVKI